MPAIHAMLTPRHDGVFHQQDRVLGDDAHQHDQPDQRRHGHVVAPQQQGNEGAPQRQRQCRQDGDRMQEALEEQHQHHPDAQHACQHGQGKVAEHVGHQLGIACLLDLHALGQLLDGRQVHHLLLDAAQVLVTQLDGEGDVPVTVTTGNDGRPPTQFQCGHLAQHDRITGPCNHDAPQGIQALACRLGQPHHDGYLSCLQIQLGQHLLIIALGGQAQRVADGLRRDAQRRGLGRIGPHDHFRPHQVGR